MLVSKTMELTRNSKGLSVGNLVDGLTGALHTEALWGGQGVFGPAIGKIEKTNMENVSNRKSNIPKVLGI